MRLLLLSLLTVACCVTLRAPSAAGPDEAASRFSCGVPGFAMDVFERDGRPVLLFRTGGGVAWVTRSDQPDPDAAADPGWTHALGNRFEILHERFDESFTCREDGLLYEIDIRSVDPTQSGTPPRFEFSASEAFRPKVSDDDRSLVFDGPGGLRIGWRGLEAHDAGGRDVDARWQRVEGDPEGDAVLRLLVAAGQHHAPLRVSFVVAPAKPSRADARAASTTGASGTVGSISTVPLPAAAPSNDTCAGAETIPGAGPFPYLTSIVDLTEATSSNDPVPICQADVSHGVWFAFTPASDGLYSFSVCDDAPAATTVEDTVLTLYTGTCATPAPVANGCSDDGCGTSNLQSSLDGVALVAGQTYRLVAWIYGSAAPPAGSSEVQLRVDRAVAVGPPPANDRCENAEVIPGAGPFPWLTAVTADVSGATGGGDPPAPSCQANVSRSIWYRFTPAVSGRYTFSACADAPTATTVDDTVTAVYATSAFCSGFAETVGGCDDDSCAVEAAQSKTTTLSLAAGAEYDVVVWTYGTAPLVPGNAAVQLRVELTAAPANDTCSSAAVLLLDVPIAGTTVAAVDDTRLPAGSACFAGPGQSPSVAAGRDVAYCFTAPDTARYSFRAGGAASADNLVLYATAGCATGASPVSVTDCLGAANRSAAQPEEVDCLPLAAGQSIVLTVDEDVLTAGSAFTLEATRCLPETEPDNTPATAAAIGCLSEGSIAPAGDVDFFALGSPQALSRVFAIVDGAAAASSDFDLRVTTATDTLEYDDFNDDLAFGSDAPNVAGTPLPGGAAYLRVSHYSPLAQAAPYRLCAVVEPPAAQAVAEIEPDDVLATAVHGASGWFSGALASPADVDLFAFTAAAGDLAQFGLDLDPLRNATPFNGSLALLDAAGSTLLVVNDASSASSTQSGAGSLAATAPYSPGEALLYRIRSAGTYYAKVGFTSGTPGDYLLAVALHPGGPIDADGDGVADAADCAPADPTIWAVPGEATGLRFPQANDAALLSWSPPDGPGGSTVRYDLLRSTAAGDFLAADCLVSGTTATSASDPAIPGRALFYLVRAKNACGGTLGTDSDGKLRAGASCP
jgi:hypothetical protein